MEETNVDWIFQGPVCTVLIINLTFLLRIMFVSSLKCPHIVLPTARPCFFFSRPGTHYKAPFGEYRRDAPVSQGGQSSARAYTALWHHLSGGAGRTLRIGPNGSHVCRAARRPAQHSGKFSALHLFSFFFFLFPFFFAGYTNICAYA